MAVVFAVAALAAVAVAFALPFAPSSISSSAFARQPTSPPLRMLWAWERPEDLRFIDIKTTGVAYLAATIKYRNNRVICLSRRQPLQTPPGVYLMPVIRIESNGALTDSDESAIQEIAALVPHYLKPNVRGFQFDFDARKSERGWYKKFLTKMHETFPSDLYLSITSIASWCLGDDWISSSHLPIDEVVPMFFEMGADTRTIAALLNNGNTFGHTFQALGISDKDASINKLIGKTATGILKPIPRVYMFSRTPWNQEKAEILMQEVNSWK